ncbi:hypothetical protein B0A52_06494 [Exophiala mesophila]|uniref:alcohol O-acetyltransferase n=1 Tax=Exophiala mesophila TaxID=212818 RepID=A0A438N126_EXOME|nr:hypothetical protein B0A52_06494 [Exophiala mesophila]
MASDSIRFILEQAEAYPIVAAVVSATIIATLTMSPGRLLGYAQTKYYHSPETLQVRTKSGSSTSFADFCKSVVPQCRLSPFLFNGHLQTIWTVLKGDDIPIFYKRKTFENEDPTYTGQFTVDFVTAPNSLADPELPPRTSYFTDDEFDQVGSLDRRPMLVMLHGLKGGSHEIYIRHVLQPLVGTGGWEACVVNSRGCSNSKITTSILYNARATWDIRQTVRWLKKTYPNRPLFGIGFSLGANILTNYIAEEGENCVFKAAFIMSSPWDLHAGNLALQRTWFRRNVYSKQLGKSMRALFELHVDQVSKNPKINVDLIRSCEHLYEFDRYVQGPTWGYPTEGAYYRDASSLDTALAIKIPFMALHAEDDPVTASEALPREEVAVTPYGVLCTTATGGHLGWFELGGGRWFAKVTTAYFQRLANDVDLESFTTPAGFEELDVQGVISREGRKPLKPVFEPLRRKMGVPT